MIKVRDRAHLRALIRRGQSDFLIALNPAGLVSRKEIRRAGRGRYEVFHGIDGTLEVLTERELFEGTNVGKAIERGAFYAEP